ncbi:MBOAT family protein [Anaerotruncus sp. AF02-27]|uniref:MBOAT family O-acyltransferase n=1 Tax=Anaerotruncus TaxID=244127 RepID=UPI000E551EDA|nr:MULTISPECIES: MBOAT family O-acyltransferase [Anaerotruncus]RGX54437.1 MBOAT family protein [Anaerotruncus sp. AF02-27]
MEITSLTFLYLFLPLSILLCGLIPARFRTVFLLLLSGFLYYWHEGGLILLPFSVVLFDYLMVRLIERSAGFPGLRKAFMICAVLKSVGLIAFYGVRFSVYGMAAPLGLGVFCLTSAGYVIDCYHGYAPAEHNPIHFAMMTVFFPKLYAGPLTYFNRMHFQLRNPQMTLQKVGEGGRILIQGLAKKVLLGDAAFRLFGQVREIPLSEATVLVAWTMVITMAFAVYFILSGYCDMARGIALLFGIELPDNFLYPYRATSINDFFSRFNVTVNRFIRRYIYINLGAAQGSMASGVFNILLVTILMGLWFGINLNMMMWGIYFAAFVIFERYFLRKYMEAIPTLFCWVYSMAVILVSFTFFMCGSLGESFTCLKLLFGIGAPVAGENTRVLYLLASNWLVLVLCVICSLGLVGMVKKMVDRVLPRTSAVLSAVFSAALLLAATAFLL